MPKGIQKFFDAGKGDGFITDGKDAFISAAGIQSLERDTRFSCDPANDERGLSSAIDLQAV